MAADGQDLVALVIDLQTARLFTTRADPDLGHTDPMAQ